MPTKWNVNPGREEIALLMEAGFIYCEAGRHEEARDVFAGVRALQPANETAEIGLGLAAFHRGDLPAALRHYQKALAINPASAFAFAQMGETEWFARNKDAARRHLQQAIELDPRGEFGRLARSLLALADHPSFR